MKNALFILLTVVLLVRCGEKSPQETTTETPEPAATISNALFEITTQELVPYGLSALDSVYSVAVKITAKDSAVVSYVATLQQGENTFKDSLIVSIPANETVQGQLIFSTCRVKNQPVPILTGKATAIEN